MIDMIERLRGLPPAARCPHGLIEKACRDCEIAAQDAEIERLIAELASARARLAEYEQAPVVGWITDDGSVVTTDEVKANTWKHSFGLSVIPLIARPEPSK